MRFVFLTIFLELLFLSAQCQEHISGYTLNLGEKYYIIQELHQTTETDNMELTGDISLDIRFRLDLEVTATEPDRTYAFLCSYSGLELDFFSPRSGYTISSQSSDYTPVSEYLDLLEEMQFSIRTSAQGKVIDIKGLDQEIMNAPYPEGKDSARNETIRKTLMETFGSDALKTISAIFLNVYCDSSARTCTKQDTIFFNAKPADIANTLYYSQAEDDKFRIQGIGVITGSTREIKLEEGVLVTSMKGNQTYDYLADGDSGWIIRGVSKQKIHSISEVKGHPDLPDGLKVPSITNSEYIFKGGRITDE